MWNAIPDFKKIQGIKMNWIALWTCSYGLIGMRQYALSRMFTSLTALHILNDSMVETLNDLDLLHDVINNAKTK